MSVCPVPPVLTLADVGLFLAFMAVLLVLLATDSCTVPQEDR